MNKVIPLERSERLLEAKDFMERLGINNEKLRRYTSHFKRQNRVFKRENGKILYSEQDFLLFHRMIQLHKEGNGTIAECVALVCEQYEFREFRKQAADPEQNTKNTNFANKANNANFVFFKDQLKTVMQEVQQLREFRKQDEKELIRTQDELRKLREYVENRIDERDKALMSIIRELQQEKRKKKPWWRFWER